MTNQRGSCRLDPIQWWLPCPTGAYTRSLGWIAQWVRTAVAGLAAKPILDIDIIIQPEDISPALAALEDVGYRHRGDRGVTGREAFTAPDKEPMRHVYVCEAGTLNVRNHLAIRDVLHRRDDLKHEYAAVKLELASDPTMDAETYQARKSGVLQKILGETDLSDDERRQIWQVNDPST